MGCSATRPIAVSNVAVSPVSGRSSAAMTSALTSQSVEPVSTSARTVVQLSRSGCRTSTLAYVIPSSAAYASHASPTASRSSAPAASLASASVPAAGTADARDAHALYLARKPLHLATAAAAAAAAASLSRSATQATRQGAAMATVSSASAALAARRRAATSPSAQWPTSDDRVDEYKRNVAHIVTPRRPSSPRRRRGARASWRAPAGPIRRKPSR
mmetsp:Transcript_5401/g.17031  ORF Transcript_5401/g.17031 Transcript_5401/m.17031 type:complete len:216 (+) Transcript_5401:277-924(+)